MHSWNGSYQNWNPLATSPALPPTISILGPVLTSSRRSSCCMRSTLPNVLPPRIWKAIIKRLAVVERRERWESGELFRGSARSKGGRRLRGGAMHVCAAGLACGRIVHAASGRATRSFRGKRGLNVIAHDELVVLRRIKNLRRVVGHATSNVDILATVDTGLVTSIFR